MNRSRLALACLLLSPLVATSPVTAQDVLAKPESGTFQKSLTIDRTPLDRNAPMLKSYAGMLDGIQPAVVTIFTGVEMQRNNRRMTQDDALRLYFGLPTQQRNAGPAEKVWQDLGLGTGVVVTRDGYILTNRHVVLPPEADVPLESLQYRVSLPGHEEKVSAQLVDYSAESDVAVLKVEGTDLPAATLADSDDTKVGDVVFAIGAPFGIDKTVTMGIVSARRYDEVAAGFEKQELIQTDASINPGNSGGPLVDANGRVVGINTAIFTRNGGNMGIGFAIPINKAIDAADALSRPRGFLGVNLQGVDKRAAAYYGLKGGAFVARVDQDTPAAKAGIQEGDVIFSLDGKDIASDDFLRASLAKLKPGTEVTLGVLRDERKGEVKVVLGERTNRFLPGDGDMQLTGTTPVAGMKITPVSDEDRDALRIEKGGLKVVEVAANSPAANCGLEPGDIVLRVNGRQPGTEEELKDALKDTQAGTSMLHVRRGNATRLVVLEP